MPWRTVDVAEHYELIRANFIRCEECNELFFFDLLRHPRYFVSHFKTCHLKNLLYRVNGQSEEENQRVRFGPRRRRDASAWFAQLKSTEKRMISMQDNRWSEIIEAECWSCRRCNDGRTDLTHVFETTELGRGLAFLHLRQFHAAAYDAFLRSLPATSALASEAVELMRAASAATTASTTMTTTSVAVMSTPSAGSTSGSTSGSGSHSHSHSHSRSRSHSVDHSVDQSVDRSLTSTQEIPGQGNNPTALVAAALAWAGANANLTTRSVKQRLVEAERSRARRLRATPDERRVEAQRSKKRRENLTPAQRQADYDRRKRKKKRQEESERSRRRREEASDETKQKEVERSRKRRQNATEEQRQREALRSRMRRQNATEEQKSKERERCRRRYEDKKLGDANGKKPRRVGRHGGAGSDTDEGPSEYMSDGSARSSELHTTSSSNTTVMAVTSPPPPPPPQPKRMTALLHGDLSQPMPLSSTTAGYAKNWSGVGPAMLPSATSASSAGAVFPVGTAQGLPPLFPSPSDPLALYNQLRPVPATDAVAGAPRASRDNDASGSNRPPIPFSVGPSRNERPPQSSTNLEEE